MRVTLSLCLIIILSLSGCQSGGKTYTNIVSRIEKSFNGGDFENVFLLGDSLLNNCNDVALIRKTDSLVQIAERISLDFSLTEQEIISSLNENNVLFNQDKLSEWEKSGWLEYRTINGEKRYFNRAVSNLGLISRFHSDRTARDSAIAKDERIIFRKTHTSQVINASSEASDPVVPVEMEVLYTITVEPDAVPPGEIVKCWLPFPKESHPRQTDVYLLGVSNEDFILAPDSVIHRTIYMEGTAEKGSPVIFSAAFSYRSSGQYFDLSVLKIKPYNKNSEIFRKYTSEQLPHICFTEKIRQLTDSIVGEEDNPLMIVKKIYSWFSENIPWAGALEYSIIPNIPEYVIYNRRGDCGQQTFLFMSMLRYKGIPVKWQSGWMVPPGAENLHDWCEIWFEGTGWVPADISYSLQYSKDVKVREFYISGIDSYRLIINDGISGMLYPEKKFIRSEPYDFQRGEVEWAGGNLYFDKWDYDMKITYR